MSIFGPDIIDASARDYLATIIGRETRDFADVAAHEERVSDVAGRIAEALGMNAHQAAVVRLAGRLHDVGKMFTPSAILNKTGRLTDEERAIMEEHASRGAELLSVVPHLPPEVVEGANYHHERYDGFGYERLKGEAIPYVARILAVADVYDAICSPRTYKPAVPEGETLRIMTDDADPGRSMGRRAFDPVVLRTFVRMRLADSSADIGENDRVLLEQYVASHPMTDLTEDAARTVAIEEDGTRAILDPTGVPMMHLDTAGHIMEMPDLRASWG